MEHLIAGVTPGSIAEELEIERGDVLVSVNGSEVRDVFDFRTLAEEEQVVLLIRKPDGEEWELEIEKDPYEDLGLIFENDLMSDYQSCTNKCIFCFIDQMPPGMRETLYFKDDDSRLSFLQGNYITLTNMSEEDVRRICRYHMEPMNISVHTTDPELRAKMLNNRFAGQVLRYLDLFYEAGIRMEAQIVLCKGYNDGDALHKTLSDLYLYAPVLESVSVVPVGLTKYRKGLTPLEPFSKEDAKAVIREVEMWQARAFSEKGSHFVHASDEFYLLAEEAFPEEETYDGYPQLENGVGMARLLISEVREAMKKDRKKHAAPREKAVSFGTGLLAAPILREILLMIQEERELPDVRIYGIRNDFFGEQITVAGLLTGKDVASQLRGQELGEALYLPGCMFRSGEEVFLDDMTRTELEDALGVPVRILKGDGGALYRAMTGTVRPSDLDSSHGRYELK